MPTLPTLIPISEFRRNSATIIRRLKKSRQPFYLTTNNRIEAIVTAPKVFEEAATIEEILPGDPDWETLQKLRAEQDDDDKSQWLTLEEVRKKLGFENV
jgi:PHD/YefM family antitoxin component YafN of YafNO toxin-antitoxin module